jgi:adenylosuccinate lyase
MIPRYSRPEMARIWSEENKFATWLRVEIAATEVLAERGVVPKEALEVIRSKARFDVARIDAIEREVQHDVIAFVSNVAENVGPEGRWVHWGLTSSDVVDTALALLMKEACGLILEDVRALAEVVKKRAFEHQATPMIGRTHGVHAEPMTFGLKLALWWAELQRDLVRLERARETISVGKLSGAVGTFSHLPPEFEEAVCRRLGLTPAPVASQVLQRDRHAEVMGTLALTGASLEKFATEIRALQKTEVRELEEPFAAGQKGSSAMPHKRNPVGAEQVAGLARLLRGNALAALENVALWHERDISHSSVERVIVPDSFLALDHMLRRMTKIVGGMSVNAERMRRNLEPAAGVEVAAHALGVDHEAAHDLRHAPQHVVEGEEAVGDDHALDGRMRDVALVPERDVLVRGHAVGADQPRQADDLFAADRIALVRHRRRALLPLGKRLLDLADFGLLQTADFERGFLERRSADGERRQQFGVAIALNDLRGDRRRLQAKRATHVRFDGRRQVRKCADRSGQLADGNHLARALDTRNIARQLRIPERQLQAERHRFGMHAVRAADHRRTAVLFGAHEDGFHQTVQVLQDDVARLAHLQRLRRVDDV